jgi:hypothetical protein
MRGNRTLLIVLLLLIVVVVVAAVFFFMSGGLGNGELGEEEVAVATPVITNTTEIVVSLQDIPRGMKIRVEDQAVGLQEWPNDYLPLEYFTSLQEVDGKYASTDIPRGMPISPKMLSKGLGAYFEKGRVAYAVPMDTQGAVAWAIQPGDHVDVLAAIDLIDLDQQFQSPLPNQFLGLEVQEEERTFSTLTGVVYGRFEDIPYGELPNGQPALIFPSGERASRLVVQMTVQNAIVWHIGVWEQTIEGEPVSVEAAAPPAAEGEEGEGGGGALPIPGGGGGEEAAPAGPALVERQDVEPVTLLVSRQDAVTLKYLLEMGADLDLVLRPTGETTLEPTEPVWLRYILEMYQISKKIPAPSAPPEMQIPFAPQPLPDRPLHVIPRATPTPEGGQ